VWLRQLLAVAILPFSVTVLIPLWIARNNDVAFSLTASPLGLAAQLFGVLIGGTGLFFFLSSLHEFATRGRGTLAPWDAPRQLVVHGPYRYVRNPMITGVVFILFGEALLLRSPAHFLWALIFLGINAVSIPLIEEPQLRRRFGRDYVDYCRQVPRIFPRRSRHE
jgi:protein-S-isoprenylcysteine O-methyltransferase Ste14